jgi:transcriptional regulator with XRE-family HTH domain
MKLAERIRTVRKSLHLSQTEFGDALGVTRSIIGNYEYGKVEPKKAFLGLICAVFNVSSAWLNEEQGEMFNPVELPNEELEEATTLFGKLSPPLQKYALNQIRGLLEVQKQEENNKN